MPCRGHVSGDKTAAKILQAIFIGQPYSKMCIIMSGLAIAIKGPKIGQGGMKCLLTTFLKLKYSMLGVWIS